MSVLIINRGSVKNTPYDEYLADYPDSVVLLSSSEQLAAYREDLGQIAGGYTHAEAVRFDLGGAVESRAIDLHRQYQFRTIIAGGEKEILRSARLREHLGIPGQSMESSVSYRDKLRMREAIKAAGIAGPAFARIRSVLDVVEFIEDRGFPAVIKPRRAAGAAQITILRNPADLQAFMASFKQEWDVDPSMLIEELIPGDMYHVDGLIVESRILFSWPSRYVTTALEVVEEGAYGASYTLAPADPLRLRLQQYVAPIIQALPAAENTSFHAELFHTPDDRIVLCEIGSRTAGWRIRDMITLASGIDINREQVRAQAGLPVALASAALEEPISIRPTGGLVLPPRTGILTKVPAECPFPWVRGFQSTAVVGRKYEGPDSSIDSIASLIFEIEGSDGAARAAELASWFAESTEWHPAPPAPA